MKKLLLTIALAGTLGASVGAARAADVAVSLSIGEPGFYGRLDIGGFPQPQLIYSQPVVIERAPPGRAPIYLRVPPGHAKHWSRHCREYNACGERVYFVRDDWYQHEYAPRYQERRAPPPERQPYRDEHRDNYRDNYRDERPHDNRGHGSNHGHGGERD